VAGPQCPGFSGFLAPWTCAVTTYSEGVDIGCRFFDATGETPLFPFGLRPSQCPDMPPSTASVMPAM
jgi:hypothetical protein